MSYSRHETMGRFPTLTDLAFFMARRHPRWALKIRGYQPPNKSAPNIDHVVNSHVYGPHNSTEHATNLVWIVRHCRERGEDVRQRLLSIALNPSITDSTRRVAFAKKWAARL